MSSYQTVEQADTLADEISGLVKWSTATSQAKANALAEACERIEVAMPFQGRKYLSTQNLQFPRLDGTEVIDLDENRNPIIPLRICRAQVIEADAILAGDKHTRRREERQGLSGQSNSGRSESYATNYTVAGRAGVLCVRADELVQPYRLRSGQLL